MTHCPASAENKTGFGVHIKERVIAGRTVLPMPVEVGSALFLTKETIHSSLSNVSDHVRISFDLRYADSRSTSALTKGVRGAGPLKMVEVHDDTQATRTRLAFHVE